MIYGKNAWDNANLNPNEVLHILSDDNWNANNIGEFINFWSNSLYLIIDRMEKRIRSVVQNIFNNPAPSLNDIVKSLKTKSPRWPNIQVNRIANIIHNYLQIRNEIGEELFHVNFQNELNCIGPVYTIWCHYLIDPRFYPPIDKFNFTAYSFIVNGEIRLKPPHNFTYPFANTDYNNFQNWFLNIVQNYNGNNYLVEDIVNLDKALMSFGAFVQKISQRNT